MIDIIPIVDFSNLIGQKVGIIVVYCMVWIVVLAVT